MHARVFEYLANSWLGSERAPLDSPRQMFRDKTSQPIRQHIALQSVLNLDLNCDINVMVAHALRKYLQRIIERFSEKLLKAVI